MSRGFPFQQPRDYGATSSSENAIATIPDVIFSGFSPTEFMSLGEAIARNITSIKSKTTQLERVNRAIDAGRYKPETHETNLRLQTETNQLIEQTKEDLARLTNVVRKGDKPHKLQLGKLTTDFSNIVQKYSKNQQTIATKVKQHFAQQAAIAEQDEENLQHMSEAEKQQLIQKQKELNQSLKFEQCMMLERESRINEIEGILLDINKTMRDLSEIINQQGEQINTIEVEVDQTAVNVEEASNELQKAATYRQSYRRKILILLIIAVIIGLIVTAIVVSKLKS